VIAPPRRLGDRYELGVLLGYGGMAEVHLGSDVRLGRDVAVKTLRVDLARDPAFHARFRREAQSAASLNHPSIVAIYDTGEDGGDGTKVPFIVMEYVAGQTLREVLVADRRLMPRRALEITAEICAALDYSHQHGIVHRDIKPANVMLTPTGAVKVMDFGIARAVTASSATMTQTAAIIGTAQYLSPEQARGEHVDARSDVYSTGCLLYELLTGRPPFIGESPLSVAYQHVREDPAPPSQLDPDIPPEVDAIVLKAMAKNPANRYQSAADMRADIERALAGQPVRATPVLTNPTTLLAPASGAGSTLLLRQPVRRGGGRRGRGLPVALLALALVALLGAAALLANGLFGGAKTANIDVPELRGRTQAQAEATLQHLGLRSEVQKVFSSLPAGRVVDQDPKPGGRRLAKGDLVHLSVSQGAALVKVPTLVGRPLDEAAAALTAVGLVQGVTTARDSKRPGQEVLDSDPPAGTSVPKGSKVSLVVSSGSVPVPNVVGLSEAAARAALGSAGFNVVVRHVPDASVNPDTVVDQNPRGGRTAQAGSTVTIRVAQKPALSPTPTPTASASASPTPPPTPTLTPTATATASTTPPPTP